MQTSVHWRIVDRDGESRWANSGRGREYCKAVGSNTLDENLRMWIISEIKWLF